ncbi:MAG: nucleotide pyrophosphatase, partial [Halobacteriaceae archaeon]
DIAEGSKAYSFIPGRFYVNLEGREPRGNISESEYETVRSDIQDALLNLTDPEGNAVIKRVVTKEEAFAGPHDEIAPDLVALPHEGYDLKAGFSDENGIFDTGPRNGMHTFENATFITDEPSIGLDSDTNLYDITPTILDLMEIDVQNSDFDGQSLLA